MKKQGAIILGIGGDDSNGSQGTFYEGCMTTGCATDAAPSQHRGGRVMAIERMNQFRSKNPS